MNVGIIVIQFFIDNEIKGKWSINLNYLGNQSDYPTYLKLSIVPQLWPTEPKLENKSI